MKIVITGANGAAGRAILRRREEMGGTSSCRLVAAVRSERAAAQVAPLVAEPGDIAQISYEDVASLDAAFQGASAVIHLAGILVESARSTYETANVSSTRAVTESANRCGVPKIVLVSAIGADENSSNRYYRTKGQGEAIVRASGLAYTVLRAPLLLGSGTAGAAALKRNASRDKTTLVAGGRTLQQPLDVDDLARAALRATDPAVARNLTLDLVGPVSLADRELVERAARMQGSQVRIQSRSKALLSCILTIRQMFKGPGFSRHALDVITDDTNLDWKPAATALRITLTGIDEMIRNSLGQGGKQ